MDQTVTIGVDIGTTSVKAVAATADGSVVAATRVPHAVLTPAPNVLEHDAASAWRDGVRRAATEVAHLAVAAGHVVAAVNVAAMVPSLCPVDADGIPIGPGLLYGDERAAGGGGGLSPAEDGEFVRMLTWLAANHPDASAFWPAQAVANSALCGIGAIDSVTAMTTLPLFDFTGWDTAVAEEAGTTIDRLPVIVSGAACAGTVLAELGPHLAGVPVGGGTIDAFGEQLVAGADHDGDVLVILGATLITWACVPDWIEVPGLWTVPHTAPGKTLIGGPSNAGGLLRDWAMRCLRPHSDEALADLDDVPVLLPYLRGERTPLHDPGRRGELHGLSLSHGPDELWRAVYEATGMSIRHHLDLAGLLGGEIAGRTTSATRIVATGGGIRDVEWVRAIADVTGLPIDCVATAEGGALGAAYLARVAAGLEVDGSGAGRWARTGRRVEPDPAWRAACDRRYSTFVERTGHVYGAVAPGDAVAARGDPDVYGAPEAHVT